MKLRAFWLVLVSILFVAACEAPQPVRMGTDGKPLPRLYKIEASQSDNVQFRMLDSVNVLRQAAGAGPVAMNAQLNAAAATHARDMSVQNRPWHFGSDGSSPIERVIRVGYPGLLIGETISETFETELETLSAWMAQPDTRTVILDKRATDFGFAWYQESSGKIWWTLILGDGSDVGPANFVPAIN